MSDTDGPVIGDGPARVVRDFPHVAIGVGEGSGHAAPLGACRRPHDLPAGLLGLGKDDRNLFGGSNILCEFDTGCAVAPERGPEPQDHATSLEEADLLVRLLCAGPAHRLIKGSGPGQIADAEGYQTDALLHLASIAVDHDTHEPCCHLYAASAGRIRYTDRLVSWLWLPREEQVSRWSSSWMGCAMRLAPAFGAHRRPALPAGQ